MSLENGVRSRKRMLLFMQLALILAPFALFFDAALMFRGRINLSLPLAITIAVVLNVGLLVLSIFFCRYFLAYQRTKLPEKSKRLRFLKCKLSSYLPVTLVAVVFSILALFQFDTVPLYDGSLYYDALISALEKFTFSPDSLLSTFSLLSHPTQGAVLLTGTGEMLFPRQSVGVYIVTLLVTLVAIFSLYAISGRMFPQKPAWIKAAGTAVFAFCPYLLGLFSHMNPDYITLLLFIIFIYAFAEEWDYLASFLALLLVFSKEIGILFYVSFLIPAILTRAGKTDGKRYITKLRNHLFPKRLFLYSIAPLLFLYYALFSNGLSFGEAFTNKSSFRWDNNGVHCFGINIDYISAKLDQILYVNFFWLTTLLFIMAVFVYLFRNRKSSQIKLTDDSADISLLSGIAISTLTYAVFSCLYITVMCPRYNVCFALPISIFCIWSVSYIWKNHKIAKIIMGIIILLLLVQNYYNIDPSLFLGHEKINIGYSYIYTPTKYMNEPAVSELYVYNHTYTYSDDLLNQALKKIEPGSTDCFVSVDEDWAELYLTGEPLVAKHLICWDSINLRRTFDDQAKGVFLPKSTKVSGTDLLSGKQIVLPDNFYFLVTAHTDGQSYAQSIADRGYTQTDSFMVSNYLGYLTVYHFQRNQ